jgi:hypothetical protein
MHNPGVRVPKEAKDFLLSKEPAQALQPTQPSTQPATRIFSGVKRPELEDYHLLLTSYSVHLLPLHGFVVRPVARRNMESQKKKTKDSQRRNLKREIIL